MVYIPEEKLNCSSNTDDNTSTDDTTTSDDTVTQENRSPLVLPSGCLSSTVLKLSCKGIQERKYYSFDLSNRMISGDTISKVEVYPNDDTVTGTQATYDKQTFKVLLSGGEGITNVGILFIITTLSGEVLEFTCVLPIRPEGVLQVGLDANYVMGGQGPSGKGSLSLDIGTVDTLDPNEKATADIIHGSDGKDTINFAIPQGAPGVNGKDGANGTNGKDGTSYVNDGTVDLDVKSATTQSITYSDLTAVSVLSSLTVPAANQNGFYTPLDQSAYKGQFITQIGFSVQTEGTMTVYIIDNFDTSNTITVTSKVLNLKKDQVWYDFNMYLPTHMYLSVCNAGTDTGVFYFDNKATDKFKYKSGANWVATTGNLNIGVKVKNTKDIFSRPLHGKKVAIIGDSISTFSKYNENLPGRYPEGDVSSVENTWWMQLIQQTGAELTCNNSRGGAGITQVYEGDMQQRLHDLTDDTEVCFILMGTNDLGGRTFGTFNPEKKAYDPMVTTIPEGQTADYFNLTQFCDAACNMVVMLQTYYPKTKFVWITPLPRFDDTTGTVPYSKNGQTVQSYTEQIKEICKYYYWDYIDSLKIGINSINQGNYLADGLHPNLAGMTKLAEFIQNNY